MAETPPAARSAKIFWGGLTGDEVEEGIFGKPTWGVLWRTACLLQGTYLFDFHLCNLVNILLTTISK